MKYALSLLSLLFSSVLLSREIKLSDFDTTLAAIKIGSFNSLNNAKKVLNNLTDKYDILTLKGDQYNQYIVNIPEESFASVLSDVQKEYPDAFKTNKDDFETDGIILLKDAKEKQTTPNDSTLGNNLVYPSDSKKIKRITTIELEKSKVLTPQYQKVDLIDVVLQTISASDRVKSSREKMIQAKRNIDISSADYLPSVDARYTYGKTDLRPGEKTKTSASKNKIYGDEIFELTLTQNIYAGGETQNSVDQQKADYLVAKVEFKKLLEIETLNAVNAYIDVVFSRDALEANKKNIEELERILEIVEIKYDAGAVSVGELSNIKASVSNAKSQLTKTTARHTNALEYFKYVVGESFENMHPHEKLSRVTLEEYDILLQSSLQNNNTLQGYDYNIRSSEFSLKRLKSPFRPKVDLIAGMNRISDQEYFVNVEDRQYAKVILSYNLFNGGRDESEYLKAYSILKEKVYDKEAEIRKIKWNLKKFYTSLTSLQENVINIENEVSASIKMVESYWESFKHGDQDLYVLLQAQRQLNTAELDFIQTQQDSMKDYFEILRLLGDLLSYFGIDVDDEHFLDMAKANYRTKESIIGTITKDEIDIEPILKDIKEAALPKEEIKQEPQEELLKDTDSSLKTLLSFNESFLLENSSKYTVVISNLKTPIEALQVISDLNAEDKSFMYESFEGKKIKTNIAYGIFENTQDAQDVIDSLLKEFKNVSIQKVTKVQNDFRDYFKLSFLNANDLPQVKEINVEKQKKDFAKVPFKTDAQFKKNFLSAPKEFFTINITTLSSMEMVERVVKDSDIEKSSFAFAFGQEKRWIKLMMGVYPTYEEAKEALDSLGDLKTKYNPVIEKIALKQELYKKFGEQ